MVDQSRFTSFRARFEAALQAYQQTTGVTLAEHSLTVQLQNPLSIACSVENIIVILQYAAPASSDRLWTTRIMNSIKSTVSMLFTLSSTASFGHTSDLVRREALIACFYSPDSFYSHIHLRTQYSLVLLSYFLYVQCSPPARV